MKRLAIEAALLSAAIVMVGVSSALAQQREHMPQYDGSTEVTITGTVTEVTSHQMPETQAGREAPEAAGRGGRGRMQGMMMGTHLMVDTGDDVIEVHVGPSNFVESEGFAFATGDDIEVVGSRIASEGTDAIVARMITRGEETLTLRDEQGRPHWAHRRGTR